MFDRVDPKRLRFNLRLLVKSCVSTLTKQLLTADATFQSLSHSSIMLIHFILLINYLNQRRSYNRILIEMCMIIYIDILIFVFLVTRFTLSIIQRIILIHFPCTRSYRKIYYRFYNSSTTIHVVKQPPQIIAFFTEEHRLILKIYSNILPALFSVMSTALPPIKYKSIPLYFYFF